MRRRQFLGTLPAGLAAGIASADSAPVAVPDPGGDAVPADRSALNPGQWRTLAAVQDHLLPSEPDNPAAPGAREVHATRYLDRAIAVDGFDPEIRSLLTDGVGWLNDLAQRRHAGDFPDLDPGIREEMLQSVVATSAGERWLSTLIAYTLEALLADPLYGGNPDGIGWRWLGHEPGLPRPTAETIYGKLGRT